MHPSARRDVLSYVCTQSTIRSVHAGTYSLLAGSIWPKPSAMVHCSRHASCIQLHALAPLCPSGGILSSAVGNKYTLLSCHTIPQHGNTMKEGCCIWLQMQPCNLSSGACGSPSQQMQLRRFRRSAAAHSCTCSLSSASAGTRSAHQAPSVPVQGGAVAHSLRLMWGPT